MNLPPSIPWVAALIPLTYGAMVLVEVCGSGRRWPAIRGWTWIGMAGLLMLGAVNAAVSAAVHPITPHLRLCDLSDWHPVPAVAVGYLLLSFGNAWLHRSYHRHDWLWRHVHRLHHAPARMDVAGVMFQTPWEAMANALLFLTVSQCVLGLNPQAALWLAFVSAFYGMFQHFNVRTPVWLGWLIQRPEAHGEHHRVGQSDCNYSDLPLWDLCWGSWRNPARFDGEVGLGVSMWAKRRALWLGEPLIGERAETGPLPERNHP